MTTKAFWPLMDRWGIPDDKALELLGRRRGLTRTGGRPRFTLDAEEIRRLDYLREIGTALEVMFGDAGPWLKLKLPRFRGVIEGLADYGSVVAMWPSVS